MRPRDTRDLLDDICIACDVVTSWSRDHTYKDYLTDAFARSAVERQFMIIGEALNRILKQEPGLSLRFSEVSDIIGFRNYLAHGYFLIDHAESWKTIVNDVPKLRSESQTILNERPPLSP